VKSINYNNKKHKQPQHARYDYGNMYKVPRRKWGCRLEHEKAATWKALSGECITIVEGKKNEID
jgi:hypothetical protein